MIVNTLTKGKVHWNIAANNKPMHRKVMCYHNPRQVKYSISFFLCQELRDNYVRNIFRQILRRRYTELRNITQKLQNNDGTVCRKSVDMRKKLNLGFLNYTDKAIPSDLFGLPSLTCDTKVLPNYLALYSEKNKYCLTPFTGVAFYQYDDVFDGKDGYINAFLYCDKKLITKYKHRFEGVRIFIMPDCSMFDDLDEDYNKSQLKRALVGAIILKTEFQAVVIPNITYISEETFSMFFDAIKNCSVAAISLKGHVRYHKERKLLKSAIKYAVDNMPNLKTLVVYSACGKDETAFNVLKYAVDHGINIHIPQNTLRERNMRRRG